MARVNRNNSAVKRIMQEALELANDPSTEYTAAPLEDDLFEWHCTLRGPADTEFEGGLYHLRIRLPAEYPFRPPSVMMLTPNGRFELNTKICISFTSYHEELWQPAWGVRTAIVGLQGFFPLKGQAAVGVGSIEYPPSERKRLAALSREWICPHCQRKNVDLLPDPPANAPEESFVATEPAASVTPTSESTVSNLNTPIFGETRTATSDSAVSLPPSRIEETLQANREPGSRPPASDSAGRPEVGAAVDARAPSPTPTTTSNIGTPDARSGTPSIPVATSRIVRSKPRPPVMLDTAICVLLVLVLALVFKRL